MVLRLHSIINLVTHLSNHFQLLIWSWSRQRQATKGSSNIFLPMDILEFLISRCHDPEGFVMSSSCSGIASGYPPFWTSPEYLYRRFSGSIWSADPPELVSFNMTQQWFYIELPKPIPEGEPTENVLDLLRKIQITVTQGTDGSQQQQDIPKHLNIHDQSPSNAHK